MDDLPGNMTKRRDWGKHLWHGESACPHAAGTGRQRATRYRLSSHRPGSTKTELHPRSLLRGLVETEVDLRPVQSEVSQFPVIKATQRGQRRVALATRDLGCNQAVNKAARAHQEHGGSAPGNRSGSCGKSLEHSHRRIFQVADARANGLHSSAVGTSQHAPLKNLRLSESSDLSSRPSLDMPRAPEAAAPANCESLRHETSDRKSVV